MKSHNNQFGLSARTLTTIKYFLLWVVIHSITYWFLNWIMPQIGVYEYILYVILMGLGITIIAKIMSGFIHREDFYINGRFFLWIIINVLGFMLCKLIIENFNLSNQWIVILLYGLGMAIVGKIGRQIKIGSGHSTFRLREIPFWAIILIIIVVFVIISKVYMPYKTVPLSTYNTFCDNGTVMLKNNMMGIGQMAFEMEASVSCIDYKSSRCRYICEKDKPMCSCEASVFDRLFHTPGDWIFS